MHCPCFLFRKASKNTEHVYYNTAAPTTSDNNHNSADHDNANNVLDSQAYEDIGQHAPARSAPLGPRSGLAPGTATATAAGAAGGGGVEQQYSEINFATVLTADNEQQSDPGSMAPYTRLDSLDRLRHGAAHPDASVSSQYTSLTHTARTRNN